MKRFIPFVLCIAALVSFANAQSFSFVFNNTTYQHRDTMTYYVNNGTAVMEGVTFHNNTANTMNVIASLNAMENSNGIVVTGTSNGSVSNANYYTANFSVAADEGNSDCFFLLSVPTNLAMADTSWFYLLVSDYAAGNPDSSAGSYVFVRMVITPSEGYSIFSEDFNSMTNISSYFYTLPEGWTTIGDGQANYSNYSSFGDSWIGLNVSGIGLVAASTSYLSSGSATANRWLITPSIYIPTEGFSLVFKLYGNSDSYPESMKVMISTTTNDRTAFSTTLLNVPTVPAGETLRIIDLSAYAGQNVYIAFVNCGTNGYYVCIDDVMVTVPVQNEIVLTGLTLPGQAPNNGSISIKGTVKNNGASPLTNYAVQYTVDGVTSPTYVVSNINVGTSQTHTFTHNVPYQPTTLGEHTITVTVSDPNGVADNTLDNTLSGTVNVYDGSHAVQRTVLMENFTTAQCGNCPSAHVRIKNALQGRNDVIWVAHHVGYGTDTWTLNASNTLTRFYAANSTYAPALMLDRTHFTGAAFSDGSSSNAPGPIFFPSSDVGTAIQTAADQPAFLTVALKNTHYDAATRELTTTVKVNVLTDLNMSDPRVSLYLIEDSLYGQQSGANTSNYQHDHVIRAAISDITGDANILTSVTEGTEEEHTYTYTLNSRWNANHCRLVAFVNNYSTSNVNDCKVMNSTISAYLRDGDVGIDDVDQTSLRIYPNPTTDFSILECENGIREVVVINTLGQEVMRQLHDGSNQVRIETATLPAGVYLVKVRNGQTEAIQRLTVTR